MTPSTSKRGGLLVVKTERAGPAGAGDGARLMMLVLHDGSQREHAYGPVQGLPETKAGAFSQALYDEAKRKNWTVVSMKNDWKRVFSFEEKG